MKNSRLIFFRLLVISILFSGTFGCSSKSAYKYRNDIMLVEPVENYGTHFSDRFIFIDFDVNPKKINFTLKNRGDDSIRVVWSEVEFKDTTGKKIPVAGRGTLFSDHMKESSVAEPFTIKPGETIEDSVVPIGNIEQWEEWVWYVKPMFNLVDDSARNYKGKKLTLDLPIEIEGEVVKYHFTFLVYDVRHVGDKTKG